MTATRLGQGIVGLFFMLALVLAYIGGAPLALVTSVLILGIALWQLARSWQPDFDPGAAMLLGAFALLALAFAITNRPGTVDVVYALNFILFALYSPLANALSRLASPGNALKIGWLALAGAALAFAVAFFQVVVLDYRRATGLMGYNPIPSSTVALLLGFLALIGFLTDPTARRYVFLAGPALGIGTVLLSGSRGPLLAVPVLAVIVLLVVPIRRAVLLGILLAGVVTGGAYLALNPTALSRILVVGEAATQIVAGETVDADKSTRIRATIFAASYAAFLESPWIGYGWGGRVYPIADRTETIFVNVTKSSHLHSDVLDFALAAGLVGLVAYALAVLAPLASALVSPRDTQFRVRLYGTLVLCGGYVACGSVNKLLGFEYMTTFFIATAAILTGFCRDAPAGASRPAASREAIA